MSRRRVLVIAFLVGVLVGATIWFMRDRSTVSTRPTGLIRRPLRDCRPSPAKIAEEDRRGHVIVDAKCDDRGGMYILTRPKASRHDNR